MPATRILWGQVLAVALIVLLAIWGATEWTAWRLAFQPRLGPPWFRLAGWPVYWPPAFFWWWFVYDAYAPAVEADSGAAPQLWIFDQRAERRRGADPSQGNASDPDDSRRARGLVTRTLG